MPCAPWAGMVTKEILRAWLIEALRANNGIGTIVEVCKYIWDHYENELRISGDLFFTWQYQVRWAATELRKDGVMRAAHLSPKGFWELV